MPCSVIHNDVYAVKATRVVIYTVCDLGSGGKCKEIRATLTRLIDYLKKSEITAVLTEMRSLSGDAEFREVGVVSLIDTWIALTSMDAGGERNRCIAVMKSRGTAHSNQMREYRLTDPGIEIIDAYLGMGEVLTGTARMAQESRERDKAGVAHRAAINRRSELELKAHLTAAQVETLEAERLVIRNELLDLTTQSEETKSFAAGDLSGMTRLRKVELDETSPHVGGLPNGRTRK